jgi:AP-2 complex subunit alpha
VVGLISSPKYAEKQLGYMVTAVLLNEACPLVRHLSRLLTAPSPAQNHEFLRIVINSIKVDITSRNDTFQALGLVLVANGEHRLAFARRCPLTSPLSPVGGKEFAESLAADVQRLLVSGTVRPIVRKKAALCLLRLYRRNPDVLNKDDWRATLPLGCDAAHASPGRTRC